MIDLSRRTILASAALVAVPRLGWAQGAPKRGGTLVATWGGNEPQSMFVPGGGGSSPFITSTKMLERLIEMNTDLTFSPRLATAIKGSPDGRTYVITVRQGVTWHDGTPFTAEDVAFTIGNYWKPISAGLALKAMSGVRATDDHTVEVTFDAPKPEFAFNSIASYEVILPKHIYGTGEIRTNPANNAPIGTGPFKFKQWQRGSYVEMVRNDAYWQPGLPYLDRLIIRWWTEAAARSAAFEAGELHFGIYNPIPATEQRRLVAAKKVVANQNGYVNSANTASLEFNMRHPILSKREVRQAILHGIDTQFIADTVYLGFARPTMSALMPGNTLFYSADTPKYPFDVKQAGTMLDAAGYPVKGGKRFAVNLLSPGWFPDNAKLGAYVKQALTDLDIDTNLSVPDRPTSLRRIYTDYDYDIAISNQSQTIEPVPTITQYFTTDGILKGAPFRNANGYSNPEVDKLVSEIAVEIDPAKRKAMMAQFQQIVMTDVPLIEMVQILASNVMLPNVRYAANPADIFGANWAEMGFA